MNWFAASVHRIAAAMRRFAHVAGGGAHSPRREEIAGLERFRAAIDASGDAIFLVDVQTLRFVDVNATALRLLGYTREQLLALSLQDVGPHVGGDIRARYDALIQSGVESKPFEVQLRCKDGSLLPVEAHRRPLLSDGRWYVIGVCRDLTDVKRADRELRVSEARYRNLFDFNPLPMWVYDVETLAFLAVNQAAIEQYGYSRDEFLAMTIADIRPEEDASRLRDSVRGVAKGGVAQLARRAPLDDHSIWRHRTREGRLIDVEITSQPVEFSGRAARLVLAHDVTARVAAENALRISNERFELVARATNDIVWDWNLATDERWWSSNITPLLGYERASMASGPAYWGIHPDDRERVSAGVRAAIASNANAWSAEYRFRHADGHYLDIHDRGFVLRDARGMPVRMIGAMMDITERKRAEQALQRSEHEQRELAVQLEQEKARLVAAQAVAKIGSWETILPTLDVTWSAETHRIFETDPAIFLPTHEHFLELVHPDDRARVHAAFLRSLDDSSEFSCEHRIVLPGGRIKHVEERWHAPREADGRRTRVVGTCQDITERKRAEAELTRHLTHDLTTGLPRFALIEDYLQSALAAAAAQDGRVVVLYVDLDYFHGVNETRGRAVGDFVLRVTAERLTAIVGSNGKVAHVAGDEFAVIQTDVDGRCDQVELAESVRARLGRPIDSEGQTIYVTASIGVSCFPDNSATPQDLLRQAEAAMMRAKREGRNTICAFSNDHNAELQVRLALGSRLHNAIRDRRLVLHYQPRVSGQDWQILGFEALVQWEDPELGVVVPAVFIQAAEELGLIVDLGRFVLAEACHQARRWIDAGAGGFTLAINVSPIQLQQPGFVAEVRAALVEHRVPPQCMELELTESVMLQNIERVIETMQALKKLGVRLSLDDFGIGHSSLNHLRRFPIDALKIDESFVRDVNADVGAAGVCRAAITLGHQLGMKITAVGVETAAQVGYLKRIDCDAFQGFYFSPAVSAERAFEMLSHRFLAHETLATDDVRSLLLVDDEVNILKALTRTLRRDGYRIFTATNADEALDVLGREDVHVIVSDQRMPGISGTELLSKVKELHPDTVRLVLSGYTDLGAVTQAINQGAIYKFLTKPWDDEELRLQIRDAFRKHDAGRQRARANVPSGANAPP